jgi:hypothetical protein
MHIINKLKNSVWKSYLKNRSMMKVRYSSIISGKYSAEQISTGGLMHRNGFLSSFLMVNVQALLLQIARF